MYTMEESLPTAEINGKTVYGQAHIQPGVNNWIGVCITSKDLLDSKPEDWESTIIKYEGIFNCRKHHTVGQAKAKILCVTELPRDNRLAVTFEGVGDPKLKKGLQQELIFSYNENLPVYINYKSHSKKEK